jgi:hypothetical protein
VIGFIVTKKLKKDPTLNKLTKEWASKLDLSLLSKKIRQEIGWVCYKSNKITEAMEICCGVRK